MADLNLLRHFCGGLKLRGGWCLFEKAISGNLGVRNFANWGIRLDNGRRKGKYIGPLWDQSLVGYPRIYPRSPQLIREGFDLMKAASAGGRLVEMIGSETLPSEAPEICCRNR